MPEAIFQAWMKEAKRNAGLLILLGVFEVVIGILAIGSPLMTGIAISFLIGVFLLLVGVVRMVDAFKAGSFGAGVFAFLGGLLALLCGGYIMAQPGIALATLTWLLGIYFAVDGISRIGLGLKMRPAQGWAWNTIAGALGIVLAVMIWRRWPLSGAWLVGTLVGIHFILSGWTMIGIGSWARREITEAEAD